MTVAPGFRAVVFALRDLPSSDKRYLADVAHALCWPPEREPALWDTPLLLVRQSATPPVPGLRSDDEVAAGGASVLLLAMRLLQADALQWPELRFLGLDLHREAPDYVLYAADPTRWTPATLADSLAAGSTARSAAAVTPACWQVQRGLQTRAPRLPPVPGDRVPVLGLQVPLFGGRLVHLRDLRPRAEQLRAPLRSAAAAESAQVLPPQPTLPPGAVAGHHQGPYTLSLLIDAIVPGRPADPAADEAQVDLTLFRTDLRTGTVVPAALRLNARELNVLHDAESTELTPVALSDWLAELLPSCFLVAPTGEVLLLDWFHLDLTLHPEAAMPSAFALRVCGCPGGGAEHENVSSRAAAASSNGAPGEDGESAEPADPALLAVAMWSLPVFADLLASAELILSASGRYLRIESAIPVDGELTHLSALLDTTAGPRILRCELLDDAAPPHHTDDPFPHGSDAAPAALA